MHEWLHSYVIQIIEIDKDAKLGKNLWVRHLIWTNAPKLNGTKGDCKFSIGDIVESVPMSAHLLISVWTSGNSTWTPS